VSRIASPPMIVQSDRTVLLQMGLPDSDVARDLLARFAELVKSPEHVHTYRMTPLSLWNAASIGVQAQEIVEALRTYSRFPVPPTLLREVEELLQRWGKFRLVAGEDGALVLESDDARLLDQVAVNPRISPLLKADLGGGRRSVAVAHRGLLKQAMVRLQWPVEDLAGYAEGEDLPMTLREVTLSGEPFALRAYQKASVQVFHAGGSVQGGSGVVVLPCGAGKTVVGLAAMVELAKSTLILTTSVTALRQWRRELVERTSLTEEQVGEYSGEAKIVAPVTVATYQILTHRRSKDKPFTHFELFRKRNWGLIIYDEVHLLPAPVFRILADIQGRRRLGLTATLVREDGREDEVFSLIGPKKYDVPWRELEQQGFIAAASCVEVRVSPDADLRRQYYAASDREAFVLAATNPAKDSVVAELLDRHKGEKILVIGHYLRQLRQVAAKLDLPVLTGSTPQVERERLYGLFRDGDLPVLVVSKVANFAVDLPAASVAIQISGTFGSRQEEAQRLGRILRPKPGANQAWFYTLVTRDTIEVEYARRRQIFLAEQGYRYEIEGAGIE
jgi:DNA excision repair protein ERCC-3